MNQTAPPANDGGGPNGALVAWSQYFDTFLANRSVVHATLFPEKPRQMWFGYEFSWPELAFLAEAIGKRMSAEDFGSSQRRLLAPAEALHFTSAIWSTSFGAVGALLEGGAVDVPRVAASLGFWMAAGDSYFGGAARSGAHRMLGQHDLAVVTSSLTRADGKAVQRTLAALQSYSWLLEAESRQGTSTHGPYMVDGRTIVVRQFGDLSGSYYPWVESALMGEFAGPLAIALELDGTDVDINAFGTAKFTPDTYGDHLTRVGIITEQGVVSEPVEMLGRLRAAVKIAQLALYETVLNWSARERFIAGAMSYARMWECFADGADLGDRARRHVRESLDRSIEQNLPGHLAGTGVSTVWEWVSEPGRPTFVTPLVDEMLAVQGKAGTHG